MRSPPDWYPRVAAALATGATQQAAAKQCGVGEKTIRRHLAAPDGLLRGLVDHERATVEAADADELGQLRGKALDVLRGALEKGDISAAKAVLGRLVAPVEAPQPAAEPEPEVSVEAAFEEVCLSIAAAAELVRAGAISAELGERLRAACGAYLSDDLKPRPPIDTSAERVEPADQGGMRIEAPPLGPPAATAKGSGQVAAVIPIRGP